MQNPTSDTVLLVGASGATGRLLAGQLLARGATVKAVVRSPDRFPAALRHHPRILVVQADLLDVDDAGLRRLTDDCNAAASCLGHRLTWKGVFGPPYRLVTETTRRLCQAIRAHERETPARFVLMNTAGNSNRDLNEPVTPTKRLVIGLLRLAVPPHADNEKAADCLRVEVGADDRALEWCVVRPDTLTNATEPDRYAAHPSPIRNPLFDPDKTSRLNVARFMADLLTDDDTWHRWRGQMPVVYDQA